MSEEMDIEMGAEMPETEITEMEDAEILTLVDEDGQEHEFEVIDSAEFEGNNYMALIPVFDGPDELLEDSGELVIFKVIEEDGEDVLEAIEDEKEFDKVGDFFMKRLEEFYDFED